MPTGTGPDIYDVGFNISINFIEAGLIQPNSEAIDKYLQSGAWSKVVVDNFVRDYLIENFEVMWSSRVINGYYTRLSLAPGQRFASKGGYIVRFAGTEGNKLIPEGDWIVP